MAFDLEKYLTLGVEGIVKDTLRVSYKNPKQSAFFLKFAAASVKATERRRDLKKKGEHIPPFLIASITNNCNLNCTGCYAMANKPCVDTDELKSEDWNRIFGEAEELGVSFIMLAGGEPMLRVDVLKKAAKYKGILFPVFTNGTVLDKTTLDLFKANRNLVPVISIEGDEILTDGRRGQGIFRRTEEAINKLQAEDLLFGISITVTSENLETVTDSTFVNELDKSGCKVLFYVEYIPIERPELALDEEARNRLAESVDKLRAKDQNTIIISFPGDEKEAGGCLAAGRGFFHINASGGVEPCPFSPYSDINLRDSSLREALRSPLFTKLKEEGLLETEHKGSCVLFEQEDRVTALLE